MFLELEKMPERFSLVKGEIRQQLRDLTSPGFLGLTTWKWLKHYPRYFNAMATRIEKLPSTPPTREQEAMDEIAVHWKRYESMRVNHLNQALIDPELKQFRWMVEEYRVSLFAQQLGTSLTVSSKRLEKQWKKVRQI